MKNWRSDLEKEFGESIFQSRFTGETVSTGSFVVDYLTEISGFPVGRFSEVFGEEGSGKTTLILTSVLWCIKHGIPVLLQDFEATLNNKVMEKIGIDPKDLENYRVMPLTMEDGWRISSRFCERPEHRGGMIFVDSLAAMPLKSEIEEGVTGEIRIGLIAQRMANSLRQMTGILASSNVGMVFINQERSSIDLKLGGGKTTPGGKALRFYSSLRVHLSLKGRITHNKANDLTGKLEKSVTGLEIGANVIKNKYGSSYRKGIFAIRMNGGIDNIYSAVKIGEVAGLVSRGGAYYTLPSKFGREDDLGDVKLLGYERLRNYFIKNPKIWYKFLDDINKYLLKSREG